MPHLPSVERWRKGKRKIDYDPNSMATRQEMRSFACAQCHVEYYCASKETLFLPWDGGLKVEQIEATYDAHTFLDGSPFYDYIHGETGAPTYKSELEPILKLQNKATWRLDFISSENSKGFHADQEAVRILGESIDYSRRAQAAALHLRAGDAPDAAQPVEPVQGISDLSAASER